MPRTARRVLLGLLILLLTAPLFSTQSAEIFPLKGDPSKGEIVSVSDKEVVFMQGDKKVTRSIREVLKIDYREVGKIPASTTYSLIELTDGSQLLASKWLLKKKTLEATLLAGPKLEIPVDTVANVLNNAHAEANRRDWKSRVFNARGKEAIVIRRELKDDKGKTLLDKEGKPVYAISSLEATLGEGNEEGTSITFAVTIGDKIETRTRELTTLQGLLFKHALGPKATPVVCKLLDTMQDVVMVSSVTAKDEGGIAVTTPAGAKIEFSKDQLARLDYTKGKLDYLSDLDPMKMVAKSNLDDGNDPDQWHVYKDSNLNKGPLSLGGTAYPKGLALKPLTELTYNLKGDYREFEAVVGIDDNVLAAGASVLVVEGDDKELTRVTISSDDKKRHKTVVLNIKDVQKLKITVMADGEFDISRHLDLADAKVRKE